MILYIINIAIFTFVGMILAELAIKTFKDIKKGK